VTELGFVGLGNMGRPMVRRLLEAGHVVHVHSRSPGPVEEMVAAGALAAGSAAAVARRAEAVLTALPTPEDVDQVYGEMLAEAGNGQLFVEHSTIRPSHAQRWAALFAERSARYLDAPVSGGPTGATAGTLTVMVGGNESAFASASPIFRAFGSVVTWCGPSGSGEKVKLVNQLLVSVHALASAEAAAFGVGMGADLEMTLDVVGESWGASTILSRNAPRYVARDFAGAAPIRILLKDIGLINEEAREIGIPLPLAALVEQRLIEARDAGLGDEDIAALVKLWEAGEASISASR
jgi:3-hydroxyisobutyrate dehydrogenase-like beta-hydroxyacid dehydrogenase